MRLLERFLLPLLGIVLVLLCWQPLEVGSDFWAHAAVGRWIVQHHAVPRGALFIWTYSGPWLAHSWLSELACYGLMRLGGEWGGPVLAVALTALIGLIIFAVALWPVLSSQRRLPLMVGASAFLAIMCCSNRFVPRPEIFTTLFTVCLYSVLAGWRSVDETIRAQRGRSLLIALPLLFALWTNLHGAVLYGIVVLWLAAICDQIQYRDLLARQLLFAATLSTCAILINPYGAKYLLIYTPVARHSFYYIGEWLPFWVKPRLDLKVPFYELILVMAALASWLSSTQKRWSSLAWLLLATVSFVQARRNMDLLAITSLAIIAREYSAMAARWMARFAPSGDTSPPWRAARAIGAIALLGNLTWMASVLLYCQSGGSFINATRQALPTRQADVVQTLASPRLHALNLYNSAAYLEWRLANSVPLYIDGLNAYPDCVYRTWRQMWEASPNGVAALQRSGINCVMAGHIAPNTYMPNLINSLATDPDWVMIYNGSDGSVLVRRELLAPAGSPIAIIKPSSRRTAILTMKPRLDRPASSYLPARGLRRYRAANAA